MAKELPFFKFTVSEWMNGDISMAKDDAKGLFADICAWYWFKDCRVTKAMLEQKFSKAELLAQLYQLEVIKVDGSYIYIEFLDEQFSELFEKHEARKAAGSKGGKKRSSNAKAKLKQHSSYKDKDKDKEEDKEEKKSKEKSIKERGLKLMKNSGITVADIEEAFLKTKDITRGDPQYYFNQVLDWSSANSKMKTDWVAAVRNWARGDLGKGQLKLAPIKPKRLGDEEVRR